ncbi:MAG: LPS biosynthesis protein WbpP, partial [Nitrosopumilus sp.]|nr:LPS biosynthesis protein WbpP [Nitrosopumilus sp.]
MLSIESQNAVGEVFNTGAGVPTTVLHLVEMVNKILGKDKINLFATPRV